MRICFVALNAYDLITRRAVPRHCGGAERQQELLARALVERGYQVSFITWDMGDELVSSDDTHVLNGGQSPPYHVGRVSPAATQEAKGDQERDAARVKVETHEGISIYKTCRREAGWPGLRFFVPRWSALRRAMAAADANVYYQQCADALTGQVAGWVKSHGRKFVFAAASDSNCDPRLPNLKTARERMLYRRGLRLADWRIAQTRYQQQQFARHFGCDTAVIASLGPTEHQLIERDPSGLAGRDGGVLWVGRIDPDKRPELLAEIARRCPQVRFYVVGGANQDSDWAKRVLEQLRGQANIVVHGRIARDALDELYRQSWALLCTSAREGFPNTFLEAWSTGLPVVSSYDPDGLIAEHSLGYVSSATDQPTDQLADQLLTMQRQADDYHACAARCYDYFRRYHSVEAIVRAPRDALGRPRLMSTMSPHSGQPLRLALIASSLERGGAEGQLIELANRLDPARFEVDVVCLSADHPLAGRLADHVHGFTVLPKRHRFDVGVINLLTEWLSRRGIQVAHTLHFDAEIMTRLAAAVTGTVAVIGSERNSAHPKWRWRGWLDRLTIGLCQRIIANSEAGKQYRQGLLGCDDDFIEVIPNGVDTRRFCPGDGQAVRQRLELGDRPVVTIVANFKPQKNHAMFFAMAQKVAAQVPEVRFLLIGGVLATGPHDSNVYHHQMQQLVERLNLADRCVFAGRQEDLVPYYRASDVVVLTSRHEGTPNVVLEAMACGQPVVVTDVGDSRQLVGDDQWMVAVDDAAAMAQHVARLLADQAGRQAVGQQLRQRVMSHYSFEAMVDHTAAVYRDVWCAAIGG